MQRPAFGLQAFSSTRPLWERLSFAFVLLVWLEALVATQIFIGTCASPIPVADDATLFLLPGTGMPLLEWSWGLHNEHRLPVPMLALLGLHELTGDMRTAMFVQAQIYALTALACILLARKLRGGSRPWDAFFPLMWLQLGNTENLLMGFQLCIAIPTACACALYFLSALSPARLAPSRAIGAGLALLTLPCCGGGGLLYVPALGGWLAWLGWSARASPVKSERRAARIYLGFVALTVALCIVYFVGYQRPPTAAYDPQGVPTWKRALCTLAAPFGPASWQSWPFSGWLLALGAGAVIVAVVRGAWRARLRDPVALGTLALLAGGACLAFGIAYGRPTGSELLIANRYIPLPAPFFVALTLGALALFAPRVRELALAACCIAMVAATPASLSESRLLGGMRRESGKELDRLARTHAEPGAILQLYTRDFMLGMYDVSPWYVQYFAQHHIPPFDHDDFYANNSFSPSPIETPPLLLEYTRPPVQRLLDDEVVSCVAPGTNVIFECGKEHSSLCGFMGAPVASVEHGWYPAVRVRGVLRAEDGTQRVIGELALDPVHVPAQRGMQRFEFTWEGGVAGRVALRVDAVDPHADKLENTWIKLRGVRLQ